MSKKKNRWGLIPFLAAFASIVASMFFSITYPPSKLPLLYSRIFPLSGLATSLILIFTGHFAYPRVHNRKIYVSAYICGFVCILFFVLNKPPFITALFETPQGFFGVIILTQLVNMLIFIMLPSYVKYRAARSTMLALMIVEVVFLLTMRFAPSATLWVRYLWFDDPMHLNYWVGPVVFMVAGILSIWKVSDDFYLGGVLSGCALFYAQIWVLGIDANRIEPLQMILFNVVQLFLSAGILVHGFFRLENSVCYDPLLQIYNREFCSKIISEQSKFNTSPPFSVAMVDIDHFKNVNDTYGHQAGDAVLYSVAQAVNNALITEGVVCRYGGEELAVFFPQKSSSHVVKLMEEVRMGVEKIKTVSAKKSISVTISVGVSQRDNHNQTIMDVIHAADKALYRAKHGGRNQVKSGKISGK
ncbi:MAG TPA: GGDEF domain-containing protein [Chitinispirillaceae bacterium]|nr:GGDEF domain-containing protein [Chitinispirillaceae bacterium]